MSVIRANGFTGRHMLAILIAFFGTVIAVNVLMAYLANTSWSGMLSKNTYVASQDFNRNAARAREWTKEGFRGDLSIEGGMMHYRLEGPADKLAGIDHVEALLHRPVGDKQDFAIRLTREHDRFSAPATLKPGPWIVDLAAMRGGELVFHQAQRIVSEGR